MTELKHTKSPWLIADDDPTFVYALGPHGTNLFWVPVQTSGPEKIGREEAIANARLIAAAPDLLAACQAFSALYGRLWDTVEPAGGGFLSAKSVDEYDKVHAQMSAVIAKATGSEK